jgi:hypothetical protein
MKKIGFFGLLIFWTLCFAVTAEAAVLSPAISVLQDDVTVIKTGVGTNSVSFDESDFTDAVGNDAFTEIRITALPDAGDGVLKMGAKEVAEGEIIPRARLEALRFVPAEEGKTAVFSFMPNGNDYEKPFVCTVYMLDTLNFPPQAKNSVFTAMENITVYGTLPASDPDGDTISYHLAKDAENGTLQLTADGSFSYLANANSKGEDSFSYYAADRYGNRSDIVTVAITTMKNKSGIVYTDLKADKNALPAVSLAEKGILIGEKVGDDWYFYPEKTVTRADFLMMAMQMCEIDTALFASDDSGFADKTNFTDTQNRYISTAARMGLVIGLDTENGRCFCPDAVITAEQASTLLGRLAKYKNLSFGEIVAASIDEDGVISDDGMAMLASVGFDIGDDRKTPLTRADVARLLYTLAEKE